MSDTEQIKAAFLGEPQEAPEPPKPDPPAQEPPAEPPDPPKPAATVAETKEQSNNQEAPEPIRDPEAYVKANLEKYQRLLSKSEEKAAALEAKLTEIEAGKQADFKAQLEAAKADWSSEVQTALDAVKDTAIKVLGFDEERAKKARALLTATDAESLQAQIDALSDLKPTTSTPRPAIGNSGQDTKPSKGQEIYDHIRGRNRGNTTAAYDAFKGPSE